MKQKKLLVAIFVAFSLLVDASASAQNAKKGGVLNTYFNSWPKSLNYFTSTSKQAGLMRGVVHVYMIHISEEDLSEIPMLAEKWEVGKDNLTYTFFLRKDATFSDGSAILAEDVKFTFDLYNDVKRCVKCEARRSFVGPIESIKVLDPHTVQFKMKHLHFRNLQRLGGMPIFQKSFYEKGDFNKDYQKTLYGGGFYTYNEKASKFRKKIVLDRRKNHWLNKSAYWRDRFNFDKIVIRYIEDPIVSYEAFKKRELDFFYFDKEMIKFWDERKVRPFTDNHIQVAEAPLVHPSTWTGVAINMRRSPFDDVNFRKALQYAFNRDLVIEKIYKNHARAVSGPFSWGTKYSANLKPIAFDPKMATMFLKKAGFTKVGEDGILFREVTKEGKKVKERASFTIMHGRKSHDQWLTIYKEDAKKIGIEIKGKFVEWSRALKLADEFKFEGFALSWAGAQVPSPRQLWHGSTAMNKGTSNFSGLNDDKINAIIDKAPTLFDESERIKSFALLEKMIVEQQPYIFRWVEKNHKVAYWKDKIKPFGPAFYKFSGDRLREPFYTHWQTAK